MRMSFFEIMMLVCFGAAWPFSIYRSATSRSTAGKSVAFLFVVFVGYLAGVLHKLLYRYDYVIFLYALNGCMVLTDIVLYFRNRLYHIRESLKEGQP
jgi:sterol desaturase/sphingolipid hydroxylase (fatty acid hydroxylase superfamily)